MVPTALTEDRLRDNMLHIQRGMAMACKYTCHVPHDGKKLPHNIRPKKTRAASRYSLAPNTHTQGSPLPPTASPLSSQPCASMPHGRSPPCPHASAAAARAVLVLRLFTLGPRRPPCPSTHAVHHMQSESPGPPEDPPPIAPANCSAPAACQD